MTTILLSFKILVINLLLIVVVLNSSNLRVVSAIDGGGGNSDDYGKIRRGITQNTPAISLIGRIRCGDTADADETIPSSRTTNSNLNNNDDDDNNKNNKKKRRRRRKSKTSSSFVSHIFQSSSNINNKNESSALQQNENKSSDGRGGASVITKKQPNNDAINEDDREQEDVVVIVDNDNKILDVEFVADDEDDDPDDDRLNHHAKEEVDDVAYVIQEEEEDGDDGEDVKNDSMMDNRTIGDDGGEGDDSGTGSECLITVSNSTMHLTEENATNIVVKASSPLIQGEQQQLEQLVELQDKLLRNQSKTPPDIYSSSRSSSSSSTDDQYVSSGYWQRIDQVVSFGLSTTHDRLRLSRQLRPIRKATARITGLHGFMSGKPSLLSSSKVRPSLHIVGTTTDETDHKLDETDFSLLQRRMAAIRRSRKHVVDEGEHHVGFGASFHNLKKTLQHKYFQLFSHTTDDDSLSQHIIQEQLLREQLRIKEEIRREKRVEEIDRLIATGQEKLLELQCEKDALQRRPNPLYNYTTTKVNVTAAAAGTGAAAADNVDVNSSATSEAPNVTAEKTTREFNFPSDDLVNEYLDEIFASRRIIKMDHAFLWKCGEQAETDGLSDDDDGEFDEEEDYVTVSVKDDVERVVYNKDFDKANKDTKKRRRRTRRRRYISAFTGGGSGSISNGDGLWALRQTKLGIMVGEAIESAGYKAICAAVMSSMARTIAALHGINVMSHSDIRLWMHTNSGDDDIMEKAIDDANDYAQAAVENALVKHEKKKHYDQANKKQQQQQQQQDNASSLSSFVLRDAVVETMLSNCQISAPILKIFPLAWQRGLLSNLITLITCVISDFADGIQLQILGHQLAFTFKPVTETDMIDILDLIEESISGSNSRHTKIDEFEQAVQATAADIAKEINMLDKWHERVLGGTILKEQIANLIARIVLTLVDDILCSANLNLWNMQAPKYGPHVIASLEYRTLPQAPPPQPTSSTTTDRTMTTTKPKQ